MAHAELSPSSSHRWLRCTASVPYVRGLIKDGRIPKEETSKYADEGTVAHEWCAKALTAFRDKGRFDYDDIPDRIMANHVKAFVDLVTSKVTGDGQLLIEHRMPLFYAYRGAPEMEVEITERKASSVGPDKIIIPGEYWVLPKSADDLSEWGPFGTWDDAKEFFFSDIEPKGYWMMEYGTGDAIVLTDEALYVIDFKYGVGVSVEGKENDQTGIYAESFIVEQKLRDRLPSQFSVEPTIFQPRDACMDLPPERVWFTSLGELDEIAKTVTATAELIRAGRASGFVPSKKACRFCRAKALCKAKARHDLEPVSDTLVERTLGPIEVDIVAGPWTAPGDLAEAFSDEYLEKIAALHLNGEFTDWLNSVVSYVMAQRLLGNASSDLLKLVQGKKNRTWTDEDEAIRLLRQKIPKELVTKEKVISPSAAWDLIPAEASTKYKNKINALIVKPEGELTLALATDKRPAVNVMPKTAQSEFGDAMDEDFS